MPFLGAVRMVLLRTEGIDRLIADVVDRVRLSTDTVDATEAGRVAMTLGGRLPEDLASRAVAPAARMVLDAARRLAIRLEPGARTGDLLTLTRTGRLAVTLAEEGNPPDRAHVLGALRWGADRPVGLFDRYQVTRREMVGGVRAELRAEPVRRIHDRIERIAHAVVHMAPVLIYVGDRVYSNLRKYGDLPGRSFSVEDQHCLLNRLRRTPVEQWDPEDACFVVCCHALLMSGPTVRVEEFNGCQLIPTTLEECLTEHIVEYGARVPPRGCLDNVRWLELLATECASARALAVRSGGVPYRTINGLTLYKRERMMPAPTGRDAPAPLLSHLAARSDLPARSAHRTDQPPPAAEPAAGLVVEPAVAQVADMDPERAAEQVADLVSAPAPEGFSTAFEGFLHEFLRITAEAFDSDVSMSRGPRALAPLRATPGPGDVDPLTLDTGDFYCCVVPRPAFDRRFGDDRTALVRVLSAYSARMRFNTWHYLPHILGIHDRTPSRDDWYFAPTMPDVTELSDQQHTGHVAFGVRHAIRIPIGISYDGRFLPGLYDLRLMRTAAPRYTHAELRGAIASAAILARVYQNMSRHQPIVRDFDNNWYQRFYG